MSLVSPPRVTVYVQEACYSHRYIRGKDDTASNGIVERPERLHSVAMGLAAAIARLEELAEKSKPSVLLSASESTANRDSSSSSLPVDRLTSPPSFKASANSGPDPTTDLSNALDRLTIGASKTNHGKVSNLDTDATTTTPTRVKLDSGIQVVQSAAKASLLTDPAVKFIHGDIDGPGYIDKFVEWAAQSAEKVSRGECEIPEGFHQGDLYLCPQSYDAVAGALGTVCQAVDGVLGDSAFASSTTRRSEKWEEVDRADLLSSGDGGTCVVPLPSGDPDFTNRFSNLSITADKSKQPSATLTAKHAFVAVRPPGHHCGDETPSGFCFVNNVMVGAAHAHLKHGVNRIVVFDIDLHHGNGTQSIAWSLNEEAFRATENEKSGDEVAVLPAVTETSRVPEKHATSLTTVENPSVSTSKTKPELKVYYGSLHDVLSYPCEDGKLELIQAASTSIHGPHGQWVENIHLQQYSSEEEFLNVLYPRYCEMIRKAESFVKESAANEQVLVFISCGFDASLHEYPYMSRHGRTVPTSFYYRMAKDIGSFAAQYAQGRVISVLEGGYSQRALASGAFAHLVGLVNPPMVDVSENWWDLDNIIKLENSVKSKNRRVSAGNREAWIDRTLSLIPCLDVGPSKLPSTRSNPSYLAERMTLRDRKRVEPSPTKSPVSRRSPTKITNILNKSDSETVDDASRLPSVRVEHQEEKRLPRVILRVKAPEES